MAPPKRRKTYLDPESTAHVPKSTRWRLANEKESPRGQPASAQCRQTMLPGASSSSNLQPPQQTDDHVVPERPAWDLFSDDEECLEWELFSDEGDFSDEPVTPPTSPLPGHLGNEPISETAGPRLSDLFNFEELAMPLLDSQPLTRGDALVMLLDVAIQFGLSWAAIEAIQKLFNKLLGKKAFPESKYLFKKLCGVNLTDIVFYFYCLDCKMILAETTGSLQERQQLHVECTVCRKAYEGRDLVRAGSFFVSLPFDKQLAAVLSSETAGSAVMASLTKANAEPMTSMGDITDGHRYRFAREEANMGVHDLTLTINSDGSPVFKSSKYAIWPVQVTINELPPRLRWKNVLMPLLWYGNEHPDMTLLLQAFVSQMKKLNESGVTWTFGDQQICSKVFCICCCADSPAKASMQHMMQYNGYFGCSWCYHPGKNVDGTVKYSLGTPYADRTDEEVVDDMTAACREGRNVRGVKGASPLINLPGFSPAWAWSPDYMHCVLLGVSRQVTDLWLTGPGDYYCGQESVVAVISRRLCSIKMPECVNRQPRALDTRKNWKASEWQGWLLHYSIPCLSGILDTVYLEHWSLLVAGVSLLLKDSVNEDDVEKSTRLLTEFVVGVEVLYREETMTYNVHQILHLPKSVLLFGPLWAHSCFNFETNMGKLLRLVTSSNGVALQIATRLLLQSSFFALKGFASEHALLLLSDRPRKGAKKVMALGKAMPVADSFVAANVQLQGTTVEEVRRLKVAGATICSDKYDRHKRVDCTAVILEDGTYARAERIFCSKEECGSERFFILSHVFHLEPLLPCQHLKNVRERPQKCLYLINEHARPCAFFSVAGRNYFCDLPNSFVWS